MTLESCCHPIVMPSKGVHACTHELMSSQINERTTEFSGEACCLPPVSLQSLCLLPKPLSCTAGSALLFGAVEWDLPRPMPLRGSHLPADFPAGPPPPAPPTLPCSAAAAAGPSRSPANQTPIVLPHLECSANCQPQKARSASSARRCPRFIHKHWFLKGWCLCPQRPHWAYLETWSGRKSPRWLGREGVSMIISEQEVGLASGRCRACIK